MEAYERRGSDRTWRVIEAVQLIADSRGIFMAEVALAWVNNRPAVVSTILVARTTARDQPAGDRIRAVGRGECAALEAASDLEVGDYPYGELGIDQRSRKLAGG